jgi:hypothetical protein
MKKIIALCFIAVLGLGCDSDPGGSSTSGDVIMPLKVGNEWCYATEWYTNGSLDTTFNGCYKITNAELIDSLVCYYDNEDDPGGNDIPFKYYTNRSDGLWVVFCGGIAGGCWKKLSIPFPATIGTALTPDTSIYTQVDSANGGWKEYQDTIISALTLVSLDTLVEVPAGSFHCYKYENVQQNSGNEKGGAGEFYCYAVNKGLIYSELSYFDKGIKRFAMRNALISLILK